MGVRVQIRHYHQTGQLEPSNLHPLCLLHGFPAQVARLSELHESQDQGVCLSLAES